VDTESEIRHQIMRTRLQESAAAGGEVKDGGLLAVLLDTCTTTM
jgi:hypothetical protein